MSSDPRKTAQEAAQSEHLEVTPTDQASLEEAAQGGVLYAVLDACDAPQVPGRVLALGEGRGECLYRGSAAENAGNAAPYLARVDSSLLEWIAATPGGQPWGIFIIARAEFSVVSSHLRKFLTVTSPDGEDLIFRYYDPRILPAFLGVCSADEVREFFGPCEAFVVFAPVSLPDEALTFNIRLSENLRASDAPLPRRATGERFRLRDEHIAVFRRKNFSDEIINSFQGTKHSARRDNGTGDILISDPRGRDMRLRFDGRGFVGGLTSPLGRTWQFENDARGRLLALTTPSTSHTRINYDAQGNPEQFIRDERLLFTAAHDEQGRLERLSFPDATQSAIGYRYSGSDAARDPEGKYVTTLTNRLTHTETFDYNADGDLIALTDGNGNTTRFEYGDWSLPARIHHPDGSHEEYAYDPAGALEKITAASGAQLEIVRNAQGRISTMRGADDNRRRSEAHFTYDDEGRITEARNDELTIKYQYDAEGRVTEEDQGGDIIRYAYDESGLLSGLTYPTGEIVTFEHDADLRLSSVLDWANRRFEFEYALDDRGWNLKSPDNLLVTARQSAVGYLTALEVRRAETLTGHPLARYEVEYDEEDRVRVVKDSRFGEQRFTYDSESQLLTADSAHRREAFAYDAAGNRTTANGVAATFNALNQLTVQGAAQYTYDERGNVAECADGADRWRYTFDGFNRLTSAEDNHGQRVTFGYDAFGRRIWKKHFVPAPATAARVGMSSPAEVVRLTRYVWAGEQLVREVYESQDAAAPEAMEQERPHARDYLYVPGTFTPLLLRVGGQGADAQGSRIYLYQTDQLGVPRRLFDERGAIAWEADYAAFGAARVTVSRVAQPLRLPGQYADAETGLHYNRFRYYDPSLGRYITRDPVSYLAGLNLYNYSSNNPVNDADPLGLWPSLSGVKNFIKKAAPIVAAVAVGVAVGVLLAPVALPLAIIAGGIAAGAVYGGLNEGLENGFGCLSCVAGAAAKGALVGGLAAVPLALLPATAGVAAFMGAGVLSGGLGYTGDWAVNGADPNKWSWGDFAKSAAFGGATAGAGRYLGPKVGNWWRGGRQPAPQPQRALPPPSTRTPAQQVADLPGHGNARHGSHTTNAQQTRRVQTGMNPDGVPGNKVGTASRFDSPEAELDAVRRAQARTNARVANGDKSTAIEVGPDGVARLPRDVSVVTGHPGGYGSGVEVIRNPATNQPLPGRPVQPTGQNPNARVVLQYDPSSGTWKPVTQFPTNDPVTP